MRENVPGTTVRRGKIYIGDLGMQKMRYGDRHKHSMLTTYVKLNRA